MKKMLHLISDLIPNSIQRLKGIRREVNTKLYTSLVASRAQSMGSDVRINRKTRINNNTYIGNNVHINGAEIHGTGDVRIGDNVHFGLDCMLISSNHDYLGQSIPYDDTNIEKPILIEDNVWIGSRAIILGGVTIGEGAIIQAGAVVSKSIEKCGIAGGNPAKVFKHRDKEHYERLKALKKFH